MLSQQKTRYNIKRRDPEMTYKPKQVEYSYYQICSYPSDGFYEVRKLIYSEKYEIVDIYEKMYPKKKINTFIKNTHQYKYCMYPTPSLKLVSYPNPEQIITANSSLLND